jgi:hypothetical protein
MGFPRRGIIGESLKKLPANARPPNTAKKHGGEGAGKTLRHKEAAAKRVQFTGKPASYAAKGIAPPRAQNRTSPA